jgi:hypothetical protein
MNSWVGVPVRPVALAGGALAFALLATLNSGGYRYGASDQAFYVPAIFRHLDPSLFPRDATLIESQARLLLLDELVAHASRTLGIGVPDLFLAGFVVTMGLLYAALVRIGTGIYADGWTTVALVAAATLRHRIAKTGANTLEGYFHPRVLAFAIGLFAIGALLRRRSGWAVGAVVVAALVHPTTALWFGIWVACALAIDEPRLRILLAGGAALGVICGALLMWRGPLGLQLMDPAWLGTLADKDYVFPTAWPASAWLLNTLYPAVIAAAYLARRRRGLLRPGERGVVFGCLGLVAIFLVSLPFVAARISLAVQLQVSRVFWMADLLATVYLIWGVCEAPRTASDGTLVDWRAGGKRRWRAAIVAGLIGGLALARGMYVLRVEHPGRALVERTLPPGPWREVSSWLLSQPSDVHVLADPGHAWRYGTSLRVSALRDVYLEDVKDGSIGMYTREIALRVAERRAALGDFAALTPEHALDLARRYDLDILLTERPLPLPEVHRQPPFFVYRIGRQGR